MTVEPPFIFVLSNDAVGTAQITAPEGWDDMQHVISRDAVYHGVAVKYSLDFNFIKEGREFLQTVYQEFGVEGVALLTVYELNPNASAGEERYSPSYTGRINLSKYLVTQVDASTNAEETGFTRALLNLEDVEVDLTKLESITGAALQRYGAEGTPIALHSKAVVKRYEGRVSAGAPAWNYRPVDNSDARSGNLYIGFDDIVFNEFNAFTYNTGLSLNDEELEFIVFNESGNITVELNVDVQVQMFRHRGDFDEAELFFYVGLNGTRQRVYYWNSRTAYNGGDVDGSLNQTIRCFHRKTYAVKPGDKLYVYGRAQIGDLSGNYEFEWQVNANSATYIKVSGSTTTAPSPATGIMVHELFSRVVSALTGRNDAFYSELLGRVDSYPVQYAQDGEMALMMVLNGSAIRGFPLAERPIFAALQDAYKSLNALRPVGLGVETLPDGGERVRLEGIEHFYQPTVVLELGVVKDLKLSVAPEYYRTEVEVGFEKWESGADNSLDEVLTKQTRSTAITQLKGKYTVLSKYAASGFLIESVRRLQFEETPTREDGNDKTNFWVCLLRSPNGGFETERNQNLTVARNILSPETAYNLRISPVRNLLRHGRMIRTGLYKVEKRPVKFTQGNANYLFESQFTEETKPLAENGYITGEQLPAPLWLPEYLDFSAPLPAFQRKKIEANPYGLITFRDSLGNLKKGFLKEIKIKLTDGEADFRLLRYNG